MIVRALAMMVCVLGAQMLGGCSSDKAYSATQLQALQTREFDASVDATFDAAVGACFDLGFTINQSDKRAGFLSAWRSHGPSAWSGAGSEGVQAKLDATGSGRTSVRLNTIENGQTRVNEKLISEFFAQMESHHLAMASPPGSPGAGVGAAGKRP